MRGSGGASLVAAIAMLATGATTAAHDEDCESALVQLPVEEMRLPDGWSWQSLSLWHWITGPGWSAAAWTGSDATIVVDMELDIPRFATFSIRCLGVGLEYLERNHQLQLRLGAQEFRTPDVGERSWAWRGGQGFDDSGATVTWVRGPFAALVLGDDPKIAVELATALDGLMADSPDGDPSDVSPPATPLP